MTGAEITGIIAGATAFVSAVYGTWRAARSDKFKGNADSAAVLLGGWRDFQAETLKEVDRVRKSCLEEIAELKREHDAERAEGKAREKEMREEINRLKAQVIILIEAKARDERG